MALTILKPNTKRMSVTGGVFGGSTQWPAVTTTSGATRKPLQNAPTGCLRKGSLLHRSLRRPELLGLQGRRAVAVVANVGLLEQGHHAVGVLEERGVVDLEDVLAIVGAVYDLLPLVERARERVGVHVGKGGIEEILVVSVVTGLVGRHPGSSSFAGLLLACAQLEEQVVG